MSAQDTLYREFETDAEVLNWIQSRSAINDFQEALDDFKAGRVVDLDKALTEPPNQ
jgi:hypothetical protein